MPKMHASRIYVAGSSPGFLGDAILLQEELEESKKKNMFLEERFIEQKRDIRKLEEELEERVEELKESRKETTMVNQSYAQALQALQALQNEKEKSKKLITFLQQEIINKNNQLITQDVRFRKTLEDNSAEVIAWRDNIVKILMEERKKYMLERKAADDEIVRLRSLIEEDLEEEYEDAPQEPVKKKQKISSIIELTLCGNTEFDAAFFEGAAAAWNENKVRKGYGFVYKCINPHCDQEGEFDFDMCCYECYDKVCRNGSCKIRVTSKKKRGFCNVCFETCGY